MRTTTHDGRATIVAGEGLIDLERASGGLFGPNPTELFERWAEIRAWVASADLAAFIEPGEASGAPSPQPRQVFAIGLNYADHAAESGVPVPSYPPTFTKFPTSVCGPGDDLVLPSEFVDWEAELVAVIGVRAYRVRPGDGWSHVAGLTLGQDYSERDVQLRGAVPQFSLGKSYPGFAATGPVLVSPDELPWRDDLAIECAVNGEVVQSSRTSQLVFSVAELVSILSHVCTLLPGDLIFTGTPGGVGFSRDPARYLRPGDEVVTRIEGIGEMVQRCVPSEDVAG
ncbi:MAG TPA: fumarylacetoacetate hydrolase family protein [Rhodoglobus sp.]|nr:fumarylacetoacetate hydrolase family protein [Rhodoglobus sp.]